MEMEYFRTESRSRSVETLLGDGGDGVDWSEGDNGLSSTTKICNLVIFEEDEVEGDNKPSWVTYWRVIQPPSEKTNRVGSLEKANRGGRFLAEPKRKGDMRRSVLGGDLEWK
ncbi:hypothetical protein L1987_14386 [Smallanthus sonchifolius]|uniref:Uncharacterized protein n=1 Tax=Smallanthus sonchifolius TaxID=185202 RepID=A0ACB9J3Q1_9ASTR|nr:hypothetical protein L1987_14386 [Smallanthus sonchifolius]